MARDRHESTPMSYEDQKEFRRIAAQLEDEFSGVTEVTDGFDPTLRPTGFEDVGQEYPDGHIAFQGDFETPDEER